MNKRIKKKIAKREAEYVEMVIKKMNKLIKAIKECCQKWSGEKVDKKEEK